MTIKLRYQADSLVETIVNGNTSHAIEVIDSLRDAKMRMAITAVIYHELITMHDKIYASRFMRSLTNRI